MSDTIKPPKDNPNAAWTPKVQDRLQEQVNALRMALDTEMSAANLYAKQVAHWIEKHDALRERIRLLEDALASLRSAVKSGGLVSTVKALVLADKALAAHAALGDKT